MNVVILCGGLGSRLSEETVIKPKPLVTVGDYPILWHIMNVYSHYGFNEFCLALGYRGNDIKKYFLDYYTLASDYRIDLSTGDVEYIQKCQKDWGVSLVDTGLDTMTGGRLGRLKSLLKDKGTFMLTYGDGVSDVNLKALLEFHRSHGKLATVTAVRPSARFGGMLFDGDAVTRFTEKPQTGEGWINGGFFVFEPEVFDYLSGDETILEREPLEKLAQDDQLRAYKHDGFWQCMDTVRDRELLEDLWNGGNSPWKVW
jgi:glucose-1-phosphate cytidylyltransferase